MLKSLSILEKIHSDHANVFASNIIEKYMHEHEVSEMRKSSRPWVIRFHKVSKLKSPEEHYSRLLRLYMPFTNENALKQENLSYEDRYEEVEENVLCDTKKHEPYLDIDYAEF